MGDMTPCKHGQMSGYCDYCDPSWRQDLVSEGDTELMLLVDMIDREPEKTKLLLDLRKHLIRLNASMRPVATGIFDSSDKLMYTILGNNRISVTSGLRASHLCRMPSSRPATQPTDDQIEELLSVLNMEKGTTLTPLALKSFIRIIIHRLAQS